MLNSIAQVPPWVGGCRARPRALAQASFPGTLPGETRLTHLALHGLRPLAQFHLQEVQGGDHGPHVADVGVFQLLRSQGRAGESSQGAEPGQRARSHGRVRDLPRHHSRRSGSTAWRRREESRTCAVSQRRCHKGLSPTSCQDLLPSFTNVPLNPFPTQWFFLSLSPFCFRGKLNPLIHIKVILGTSGKA